MNNEPHNTNHRELSRSIFDKFRDEHPWFGIEQEFFMINASNNLPIGFSNDGSARPQGSYYCGVGASNCQTRKIAEEMLNNCLSANLNITF